MSEDALVDHFATEHMAVNSTLSAITHAKHVIGMRAVKFSGADFRDISMMQELLRDAEDRMLAVRQMSISNQPIKKVASQPKEWDYSRERT